MSEEYKFVAPGKLKLKGSALKIAKTSHNKTKKKKSAVEKLISKPKENVNSNVPDPSLTVNETYAEKRFNERYKEVLAKEASKMSSTTLKDKLNKMNENLSKLSEFNDVPRVNSANIG